MTPMVPAAEIPNRVPLPAGVENLTPDVVHQMLRDNFGMLVDLRGEDRNAGLIGGAVHEPAIDKIPFSAKVPELCERWGHLPLVVFTCQYSAHRAPLCAGWYRDLAPERQRVAVMTGGFRGWESMGFPVRPMSNCGGSMEVPSYQPAARGSPHTTPLPSETSCASVFPEAGGQVVIPSSARLVCDSPPLGTERRGPSSYGSSSPGSSCPGTPSDCDPYLSPLPGSSPAGDIERPELITKKVGNLEPDVVHRLLMGHQCLLVDVRGEEAYDVIPGALRHPAVGVGAFPLRAEEHAKQWAHFPLVVFACCNSVHRAPSCAACYMAHADVRQAVAVMTGGVQAWEVMGFPVCAPEKDWSFRALQSGSARAARSMSLAKGG